MRPHRNPDCDLETKRVLDAAWLAIKNGRFDEAEKLLTTESVRNNSEAQYLLAGFSLLGESQSDFNTRSLNTIDRLSHINYPDAMYQLGVTYDTGDGVDLNKQLAADLFAKAAMANHPKAKWIHGITLAYDSNSSAATISRGIALINSSAEDNFEGALRTLAGFYAKGEFGFPLDAVKCKELEIAATSDDVIPY